MKRPRICLAFIAIFIFTLSAYAGQPAPNLELHDLKGATHKLSEFRGRPVLLNFWATWCVPCAAEMPMLSEMQGKYKGKVVFIAASIDDEDAKTDIEGFVKKHKGDALTVMTGATFDNLDAFGVNQAMPATVFIDAEGNIVDRVTGALKQDDLENRLRKLTAETPAAASPSPTPAPANKPQN